MRWVGLLLLILFLAVFVGVGPLFITLITHGLFGWLGFLIRVIPEIRWNPVAIATAVACLAGLAFGAHRFLDWLYRSWNAGPEAPPPWRRGWTASLVVLVVLAFIAGTATVGAVHQVAWLGTSTEPLVKSDWSAARSSPQVLKYAAEIKNRFDADKPMLPEELQRMTDEAAARDLRLVVLNDRTGVPWFVALGPHDPASSHWKRCQYLGWIGKGEDLRTISQRFSGDHWAELIAEADAGRSLERFSR